MTKRKALSYAQKRAIAAAHDWQTVDGHDLIARNGQIVIKETGVVVEFDHAYALALGGADEADNIRPMSPEAHNIKTNGTKATSYGSDKHAIAKVRRLSGRNKAKRKRPIPSRGFDKRWRRKMDGTVERQ